MKKRWMRLLALGCALMLALVLTVPAFAQEDAAEGPAAAAPLLDGEQQPQPAEEPKPETEDAQPAEEPKPETEDPQPAEEPKPAEPSEGAGEPETPAGPAKEEPEQAPEPMEKDAALQQEPAFLQELPACAAAPLMAAEGDPAGQPEQPEQPDQANQPDQPPTNTDTNTPPETDAEGFIKAPINPEETGFYWWKVEEAVLKLKLGSGSQPTAGPWPWADQA